MQTVIGCPLNQNRGTEGCSGWGLHPNHLDSRFGPDHKPNATGTGLGKAEIRRKIVEAARSLESFPDLSCFYILFEKD